MSAPGRVVGDADDLGRVFPALVGLEPFAREIASAGGTRRSPIQPKRVVASLRRAVDLNQ